jgi:hypothetical protein
MAADPTAVDALLTKLAGVAGAAASLAFLRGSWPERIAMALGGSVVSYYAAPWMSAVTGLPQGLAGFLLGLFGMAVCAKVWEGIQAAPLGEAWTTVLDAARRRLGGGG